MPGSSELIDFRRAFVWLLCGMLLPSVALVAFGVVAVVNERAAVERRLETEYGARLRTLDADVHARLDGAAANALARALADSGKRPERPSGATGRSAAPRGDAAKERAAAEQGAEDTLAAVQLGSGAAPRGVPKDEPAAARGGSDPAGATTTGAATDGEVETAGVPEMQRARGAERGPDPLVLGIAPAQVQALGSEFSI